MPSLQQLFKTKPLSTQNGKVGADAYDIRNSKDIRISTSNSILNATVFPIVQRTLRSNSLLTSRTKETRIEQELVGLSAIRALASPIIYGTDIIRLKRKTTNAVEIMKNAANGSNETDNGIIGNAINTVKDKALELAAKIGIAFPQTLIPTRISLNDKFIKGLEPNTMATLAEIKKDGAGTILGQFLAKNAKGTPSQIGRQVIGAGIDVLKSKVRKKLFGSPLVGGQNLANKSAKEVQYDSISYYSNTVFPQTNNISIRNDLSSILVERITLLQSIKVSGDGSQKISSGVSNISKAISSNSKISNPSPFTPISDIIKSISIKIRSDLAGARKAGQREIEKTENINDNFQYKNNIAYSSTVDETADEIKLRNDLSTKLEILNAVIAVVSPAKLIDRTSTKYSLRTARIRENSLEVKLGIRNGSDVLNQSPTWYSEDGTPPNIGTDTTLDGYDFIPLRFYSIAKKTGVSFRAIISGLSEAFSPAWESSKFIGNPYNFYTYGGVDRSVSFNFKLYALNPNELKRMWEKLTFLTTFVYPQTANQYIIPPFLKFTLGSMYKNKEGFVDSLAYTIDDTTGWEIGVPHLNQNGTRDTDNDMSEYKLPMIIDVAITVKFIETKSSYWDSNGSPKRMYSYGSANLTEQTDSETSGNMKPDGSANTPIDVSRPARANLPIIGGGIPTGRPDFPNAADLLNDALKKLQLNL